MRPFMYCTNKLCVLDLMTVIKFFLSFYPLSLSFYDLGIGVPVNSVLGRLIFLMYSIDVYMACKSLVLIY